MSSRQTYISCIEADLEALDLERRLAEMADGAGPTGPAVEDPRAVIVRSKERLLRERLRRAREAPDSCWEAVKDELGSAWNGLQESLAESETSRGLTHATRPGVLQRLQLDRKFGQVPTLPIRTGPARLGRHGRSVVAWRRAVTGRFQVCTGLPVDW